jgi:propionyl-CoA carboxylase alpha chain
VDYQSAGTVEFVVGRDKSFYFLEMNTRLQVEHPVTEMITGLDLVEQMIRIAAGERLAFGQADLRRDGWAMECRINAEDPFRGFLPSTGRIEKFLPPAERAGQVRVDTGIIEGSEISIHYDSMIAKLIVHGATRAQAIERMREALDAFLIRGIASNIPFQAALMQHPRFAVGDFTTGFVAEEFAGDLRALLSRHRDPMLFVCAAACIHFETLERNGTISGQMAGHEYVPDSEAVIVIGAARHRVASTRVSGGRVLQCEGRRFELRLQYSPGDGLLSGTIDGTGVCVQFERRGLGYRLSQGGMQADVLALSPRAAELQALMPVKAAPDFSKLLLSPMPGLLAEIAVAAGQQVAAGEKLAVIEAMKMENVLRAERDGVVAEVFAKSGDSLAVGQQIVRFR